MCIYPTFIQSQRFKDISPFSCPVWGFQTLFCQYRCHELCAGCEIWCVSSKSPGKTRDYCLWNVCVCVCVCVSRSPLWMCAIVGVCDMGAPLMCSCPQSRVSDQGSLRDWIQWNARLTALFIAPACPWAWLLLMGSWLWITSANNTQQTLLSLIGRGYFLHHARKHSS